MDRSPDDEARTYAPKIRLFVTADLTAGARLTVGPEQSHYLMNVMRCRPGALVGIFNGRQGGWRSVLVGVERRSCVLELEACVEPQTAASDLWLLFAPVKRARIDFIAEKATELGVAVLQPALTRRTVATRVAETRLRAIAIEAAEQSWRLDVPEIRAAMPLDALLADWPSDRRLLFCDETRRAPPVAEALSRHGPGHWAVLVGPEGGFDAGEHAAIAALPQAVPATLGPRILRSDTAVLAALAIVQAVLGDWRS